MADSVKKLQVVDAADANVQASGVIQHEAQAQKAIKHGRAWTWAGGATIGGSVVLFAASVLIICTLTTNLGNSFSKMGPGGVKMVNYMGQNANAFMIAGLAGSAGSLGAMGLGAAFLYVGCRDAREAKALRELEERHQQQVAQGIPKASLAIDSAEKEPNRSRSPSPLVRRISPSPTATPAPTPAPSTVAVEQPIRPVTPPVVVVAPVPAPAPALVAAKEGSEVKEVAST